MDIQGSLKIWKDIKKWERMMKDIQTFVRQCQVCQRNKGEIVKDFGLHKYLHIPNKIWEKISLDIIIGLPKSKGKDSNFILDRLTKYPQICGIKSTYTAIQVVEVFTKEIRRIHEFTKVIVSDRNPKFTWKFWKELWKMKGKILAISSAYHQKIDGWT